MRKIYFIKYILLFIVIIIVNNFTIITPSSLSNDSSFIVGGSGLNSNVWSSTNNNSLFDSTQDVTAVSDFLTSNQSVLKKQSINNMSSQLVPMIDSLGSFSSIMNLLKEAGDNAYSAIFQLFSLNTLNTQTIQSGQSLSIDSVEYDKQQELTVKNIFSTFMSAMGPNQYFSSYIDVLNSLVKEYADLSIDYQSEQKKNNKSIDMNIMNNYLIMPFQSDSYVIHVLRYMKMQLIKLCKVRVALITMKNYMKPAYSVFFTEELDQINKSFDSAYRIVDDFFNKSLQSVKLSSAMRESLLYNYQSVREEYEQERNDILCSCSLQLLQNCSKKYDISFALSAPLRDRSNNDAIHPIVSVGFKALQESAAKKYKISLHGFSSDIQLGNIMCIMFANLYIYNCMIERQCASLQKTNQDVMQLLAAAQLGYTKAAAYFSQAQDDSNAQINMQLSQGLFSLITSWKNALANDQSKHYAQAYNQYLTTQNQLQNIGEKNLAIRLMNDASRVSILLQQQIINCYVEYYRPFIDKYIHLVTHISNDKDDFKVAQKLFISILFEPKSTLYKGIGTIAQSIYGVYEASIMSYQNNSTQAGQLVSRKLEKALPMLQSLNDCFKAIIVDGSDSDKSADSFIAQGTIDGLFSALRKYDIASIDASLIDESLSSNDLCNFSGLFANQLDIKNFSDFIFIHKSYQCLAAGIELMKFQLPVSNAVALLYFMYARVFYKKIANQCMADYCTDQINKLKSSIVILKEYGDYYVSSIKPSDSIKDKNKILFYANLCYQAVYILGNDSVLSKWENVLNLLYTNMINSDSDLFNFSQLEVAYIYELLLQNGVKFSKSIPLINEDIKKIFIELKRKSLKISDSLQLQTLNIQVVENLIMEQKEICKMVKSWNELIYYAKTSASLLNNKTFSQFLIQSNQSSLGLLQTTLSYTSGKNVQSVTINNPQFILASLYEKHANLLFDTIKVDFSNYKYDIDHEKDYHTIYDDLEQAINYYTLGDNGNAVMRIQKFKTDMAAYQYYTQIIPLQFFENGKLKHGFHFSNSSIDVDIPAFLMRHYTINLTEFYEQFSSIDPESLNVLNIANNFLGKDILSDQDNFIKNIIIPWYQMTLMTGGYQSVFGDIQHEVNRYQKQISAMMNYGVTTLSGESLLKTTYTLEEGKDKSLLLHCFNIPLQPIPRYSSESLSALSRYSIIKQLYRNNSDPVEIDGKIYIPNYNVSGLKQINDAIYLAYASRIKYCKDQIKLLLKSNKIHALKNATDVQKIHMDFKEYASIYTKVSQGYSLIMSLYSMLETNKAFSDISNNIKSKIKISRLQLYDEYAKDVSLFMIGNPISLNYQTVLNNSIAALYEGMHHDVSSIKWYKKIAKLYEVSAYRATLYPLNIQQVSGYPYGAEALVTYENAESFYKNAAHYYNLAGSVSLSNIMLVKHALSLMHAGLQRIILFSQNAFSNDKIIKNIGVSPEKLCTFKYLDQDISVLPLQDIFLSDLQNGNIVSGLNFFNATSESSNMLAQQRYSLMKSLFLDGLIYCMAASSASNNILSSYGVLTSENDIDLQSLTGSIVINSLGKYYENNVDKSLQFPITFLVTLPGKNGSICSLPSAIIKAGNDANLDKKGLSQLYSKVKLNLLNNYFKIFILASKQCKDFLDNVFLLCIGNEKNNYNGIKSNINIAAMNELIDQIHMLSREIFTKIYYFNDSNIETQTNNLDSAIQAEQQTLVSASVQYVG